MRTLRLLPLLAVAALLSSACSRCGSRPPPPTERFVAPDAAAVLIVPSLDAFAQQSSDALATATSFPFGAALRDARSVIAGRLGFDPFDAKAIAAAGLDPQRGCALSGRVGSGGEGSPDVVLSLPVGDAAKLEATIATLAKDRLGATDRSVDAGTPEVIAWRTAPGGAIVFAYAVVERTAIFSAGDAAVAAVRTAASVPAASTLASLPAYQQAMKALGDGLAARFFVPAGSPALKEMAQFENGVAFGLRGATDRLGLALATPLGKQEAAVKAALGKGTSGELLAQLDPSAVLVARGDGAAGSAVDPGALAAALAAQGIPPSIGKIVTEFVGAVGGSSAMALSVLPAAGKASLQEAPLRLFSAEVLMTVKDPERMAATLQEAVDTLAAEAGGKKGKASLGRNPWRFPAGGGEIALAVADGKLALAVGPARSLEALLARRGSSFKGPTAASDKALRAATGGLLLDVPRLVAGMKALPEAAWGPGQQGVMLKSMADQWATAAERIAAVSLSTDVVEGFARAEFLVEVTPAPAAQATPK